MFEIVLVQSLIDLQRSNRIVGYAVQHGMSVYAAMEKLYADVTKDETWDLNDTTLAINITDAIYNSLEA